MAGIPTNVAQLMAVLSLNTTQFKAATAEATGMLGKTGPLAVASLAAGAVIAGVGIIATKMAGDFQAGITSLVTGAGESQKNLQLVSDGVLQMAKDTGTSTSQLISGLYMIESGGFHGATGLNILKAAAEGAKVGSADLGVTADALDTILKNYPTVTNGATGAMNTLIATVSHGKTHMADLASSLASVLPAASAAGVGLDDVMGAMATMTAEGVPASEAATYLRQTIIALSAPGSQAKATLLSVGLTSKQVATMMETDMPRAVQMITNAVAQKFPRSAAIFNAEIAKVKNGSETFDQAMSNVASHGGADYIGAMRDIAGGMRQMQGLLDLGGAHTKMFQDNVKAVSDQVKNGGHQIQGWNLVQKNMNQQFDRAKEVAETLMIQLGQKLLPVVTNLFGFFADHAIPALKSFKNFIEGNSVGSVAFKVALIAVSGAIAANLVMAFVAWAIAAWNAAAATLAATWPILLIGALIALLIAGIILLVTHWKQVGQVMGWLGDRFGELFGHIGEFFGNIFGAVGRFVGGIIGWFANLGRQIHQKVSDFITTIVNFFASIPGTIHTWLSKAAAKIGEFKDQAIAKAKSLATNFISALESLPGKLLTLGENLLKKLAQGLQNGRSAVVSALSNIPLIGGLASNINNLIPKFAAQGGVFGEGEWGVVGENNPEAIRVQNGRAIITPLSGGRLAASPAGMGGGAGSSGAITIVVQTNLDGRRVAQSVAQHLPGAIRNTTGRRNF